MEVLLGIAIGLELFLIFLISKKDYINQKQECNFQELELEQKQEQEFNYQEFEQAQKQEHNYQERKRKNQEQEYKQPEYSIVKHFSAQSIGGTPKTPAVNIDASKGIIEIKGRSIPENSIEFYRNVVDMIEDYTEKTPPQTTVNIKLEYFNTSSSKCILDVFKKIETIHNVNQGVTINWFYDKEDEDMLEAGQDYESLIRVPFQMIEE